MRKFIIGIILMTFVLSSCANMNKKQKGAAQKIPENLLIDTFTGSTCNGKVNVEINITAAIKEREKERGNNDYLLYGTFRSVGPQEQTLETYLRGKFYLPNNYEPRYRLGFFDHGVMALYATKAPTLKEYIEYAYGDFGTVAYEQASKNKKVLADFKKQFGAPPSGTDATSPQPTVSLSMDIARDTEGKGWIGSFESEGFDGCHEIILVSKNGKTTSEFPPITGDVALRMILLGNPNKEENYDARRLYWFKVAEQKGHVSAPFRIAQLLDKQGKKSPKSYQQALQYYRSAAEKTGDQRAQRALANMYAEGRGTTANPAEAKKWRDLADVTLNNAATVCGSPKTIAAVYAIYQKERDKAQVAAVVGALVTGMTMKLGIIKVTEVVAVDEDVVSMDRPFTCTVYGERVGAAIDASTMPDVEYYAVDGHGNVISKQGDNSADKAVGGGIASIANKMLERPFKDKMNIKPLGGMRYTLDNGSYQATLDLQTNKTNNAPQESSPKKELPPQKEQPTEQNPKIDDWAKDYFNKQ